MPVTFCSGGAVLVVMALMRGYHPVNSMTFGTSPERKRRVRSLTRRLRSGLVPTQNQQESDEQAAHRARIRRAHRGRNPRFRPVDADGAEAAAGGRATALARPLWPQRPSGAG